MDWALVEVLVAGGLGGLCLALGRMLISYVSIAHTENANIKQFLLAQSIPIIVLTTLGMIVAWVTAEPPISPFLTGLGALGFILLLGQPYTTHKPEKAQEDV